jgi:hypothetical protein
VTLFLDLDGVLADFDRGFLACVGIAPDAYEARLGASAFWGRVGAEPRFFARLPMTADAAALWSRVEPLTPWILTGAPHSIPTARDEKVAWVAEHLGAAAAARTIVTTASRKSVYCDPGDVLVDDREKYRTAWEECGGRWVTHRSAARTIAELERLGVLDALKED